MMKKTNSNKLSAFKLLLNIPMVLLSLYFVSCSKEQNFINDLQNVKPIGVKAVDVQESNSTIPLSPLPTIIPSEDQGKLPAGNEVDENIAYESYIIDEKPEYPGGDEALIKYIAENTIYPKEALENVKEGTVYIRFYIDKNGKAESAKVIREVDPLLDSEALRVVSSMPTWKPGKLKGQEVNVWFIIPVKFTLK